MVLMLRQREGAEASNVRVVVLSVERWGREGGNGKIYAKRGRLQPRAVGYQLLASGQHLAVISQ